MLNQQYLEKYSRQICLSEIGESGQEKLFSKSVLIVGVGGLGSSAALYLAASGVGEIGLVDGDNVELSNLQRQILHFFSDLKRPKVISAKEKLNSLNPDISVNIHYERLSKINLKDIFKSYDIIIDATDNFESKFLIADGCFFLTKPYVHAGIIGWEGQIMTVLPGETACYRCVFNTPPKKNEMRKNPVIGGIAGVLGTLQSLEAIKLILGKGEPLLNCLLSINSLTMTLRKLKVKKRKDCLLCGNNPLINSF